MKNNNKEILITVMSSIKKYLMEIKKFIPDYTGPARGRKQTGVFKSLSKKDQESLKFFENEIKLEKNRTAAKRNRLKKKNLLEKLQYEVDSLKSKNNFLELENKSLRKRLKKINDIKSEKDKINDIKSEKDKILDDIKSEKDKINDIKIHLELDELDLDSPKLDIEYCDYILDY